MNAAANRAHTRNFFIVQTSLSKDTPHLLRSNYSTMRFTWIAYATFAIHSSVITGDAYRLIHRQLSRSGVDRRQLGFWWTLPAPLPCRASVVLGLSPSVRLRHIPLNAVSIMRGRGIEPLSLIQARPTALCCPARTQRVTSRRVDFVPAKPPCHQGAGNAAQQRKAGHGSGFLLRCDGRI